jgi:WD40 repeat protein
MLLCLALWNVVGLAQNTPKKRPKTNQPKYQRITPEQVSKKNLALAQSAAVKSLAVTNEKVQALVAKEAHDLNVIHGGKPNDPYIYNALYQAMDKLNPDFNVIKWRPVEFDSSPRQAIRAISLDATSKKLYVSSSVNKKNEVFFSVLDIPTSEMPYKVAEPFLLDYDTIFYRRMALSEDKKKLCRGGKGCLAFWDFEKSNKALFKLSVPEQIDNIFGLVFFKPPELSEEIVLIADNQGKLFCLYPSSQKIELIGQDIGAIGSMALSTNKQYLFTITNTDIPSIWEFKNGKFNLLDFKYAANFKVKLDTFFSDKKQKHTATSIAFSPNGAYLAIGYSSGAIMIWDTKNWQQVCAPLICHQATIFDLTFSSDSRLLAAASLDKSATVWQMELVLDKSQPYKDANLSALYDPYIFEREHRLTRLGKSAPPIVRHFAPIKLNDHSDWVMSVAFTPGNNRLITATANGLIKIWEMDMFKYADQICEKVQANLSDALWFKYLGTDDPSSRSMYIKTSDGGQRTPVSTCSPKYEPLDIE